MFSPVRASKQKIVSFSVPRPRPELPIEYTRPSEAVIEEKPVPILAFHKRLGPSSDHFAFQSVSLEMPLTSGPLHRYQSPASEETRGPIKKSEIQILGKSRVFIKITKAMGKQPLHHSQTRIPKKPIGKERDEPKDES